ncbi:MAG: hypothetical protein HW404_2011 [Anaerolineales bacterium]|nr:hypothetical protein [Anaerolineales bacterium]
MSPGAGGEKWRIPGNQLRKLLAAGMLGAAVFLVQAGAAELVLRSDRMCQEARIANWAFNPGGCQSESVRFLLQGFSHGLVGALRPDLPAAVGVLTMALLMGVLAGLLGILPLRQSVLTMVLLMGVLAGLLGILPLRQSVPAFFIFEAAAAIVFGLLGFLALYIG